MKQRYQINYAQDIIRLMIICFTLLRSIYRWTLYISSSSSALSGDRFHTQIRLFPRLFSLVSYGCFLFVFSPKFIPASLVFHVSLFHITSLPLSHSQQNRHILYLHVVFRLLSLSTLISSLIPLQNPNSSLPIPFTSLTFFSICFIFNIMFAAWHITLIVLKSLHYVVLDFFSIL